MELVTQEQKDQEVHEIRQSNIEKKAEVRENNKKNKYFFEGYSATQVRKTQKDIFMSHRELLEKIWMIGRGLIFAQHLQKLSGMKKTAMYRELRILEKAKLINIIKFCNKNIVQLTQFSVNQFQKKTRMVAFTNANCIKHAFLAEILIQRFEWSVERDINTNHDSFFEKIFEQSNFCRTKTSSEIREKLNVLRKRDTYYQFSGNKINIYVLDVYSANTKRVIERLVEIFYYLDDIGIPETFTVRFFICVVDERRKKYLLSKHADKKFQQYLQGKKLVGRFKIYASSFNLTENVFSLCRIVP